MPGETLPPVIAVIEGDDSSLLEMFARDIAGVRAFAAQFQSVLDESLGGITLTAPTVSGEGIVAAGQEMGGLLAEGAQEAFVSSLDFGGDIAASIGSSDVAGAAASAGALAGEAFTEGGADAGDQMAADVRDGLTSGLSDVGTQVAHTIGATLEAGLLGAGVAAAGEITSGLLGGSAGTGLVVAGVIGRGLSAGLDDQAAEAGASAGTALMASLGQGARQGSADVAGALADGLESAASDAVAQVGAGAGAELAHIVGQSAASHAAASLVPFGDALEEAATSIAADAGTLVGQVMSQAAADAADVGSLFAQMSAQLAAGQDDLAQATMSGIRETGYVFGDSVGQGAAEGIVASTPLVAAGIAEVEVEVAAEAGAFETLGEQAGVRYVDGLHNGLMDVPLGGVADLTSLRPKTQDPFVEDPGQSGHFILQSKAAVQQQLVDAERELVTAANQALVDDFSGWRISGAQFAQLSEEGLADWRVEVVTAMGAVGQAGAGAFAAALREGMSGVDWGSLTEAQFQALDEVLASASAAAGYRGGGQLATGFGEALVASFASDESFLQAAAQAGLTGPVLNAVENLRQGLAADIEGDVAMIPEQFAPAFAAIEQRFAEAGVEAGTAYALALHRAIADSGAISAPQASNAALPPWGGQLMPEDTARYMEQVRALGLTGGTQAAAAFNAAFFPELGQGAGMERMLTGTALALQAGAEGTAAAAALAAGFDAEVEIQAPGMISRVALTLARVSQDIAYWASMNLGILGEATGLPQLAENIGSQLGLIQGEIESSTVETTTLLGSLWQAGMARAADIVAIGAGAISGAVTNLSIEVAFGLEAGLGAVSGFTAGLVTDVQDAVSGIGAAVAGGLGSVVDGVGSIVTGMGEKIAGIPLVELIRTEWDASGLVEAAAEEGAQAGEAFAASYTAAASQMRVRPPTQMPGPGWDAASVINPAEVTGGEQAATDIEKVGTAAEGASKGVSGFAGVLSGLSMGLFMVASYGPSVIDWLDNLAGQGNTSTISLVGVQSALLDIGSTSATVSPQLTGTLDTMAHFSDMGMSGASDALSTFDQALAQVYSTNPQLATSEFNQFTASLEAQGETAQQAAAQFPLYTAAVANAGVALQSAHDILAQTLPGTQAYSDAVDKDTLSLQQNALQQQENASAVNDAAGPGNTLAQSVMTQTGAFQQAQGAAQQYDQALQSLFEPALNVTTATTTFDGGILNLKTTLQQNGPTLDATTTKGQAVMQSFDSAAQQAYALAEAVRNNGGTADQANTILQQSVVQIDAQAKAAHLSAGQIAELNTELFGVPDAKDVKVTVDIGQALGNVAALAGALSGLGSLTTIKAAVPPPKAEGGAVEAGQTYLVGEEGMELFTPGASGFITPHDMIHPAMVGAPHDMGGGYSVGSGSTGGGITYVTIVNNIEGSVLAANDLALTTQSSMNQIGARNSSSYTPYQSGRGRSS